MQSLQACIRCFVDTRVMVYLTFSLQSALATFRTFCPVMVGIFQRAVNLRTSLRHLSPHSTFLSAANDRYSSTNLYRRCVPRTSWQFGVHCRNLRTGADGPRSFPNEAPHRLPFSRITQEDLAFFRKMLPGRAITDPDVLESSNVDWLKSVRGDDD